MSVMELLFLWRKDYVESDSVSGPGMVQIYKNEKILIGPTTGEVTFAGAREFRGSFQCMMESIGLKIPSHPTKKTPVRIFQQHTSMSMAQMLQQHGAKEDVSFTPDQIIDFCKNNPDKLHPEGKLTIFGCMFVGKFTLVGVSGKKNNLDGSFFFPHYKIVDREMPAEDLLRVVVPKKMGLLETVWNKLLGFFLN